jgi:hypothetical protein
MSFKIEVKPDFLSLRWGLDSFGADGIQELARLIAKYPEDHMIINFLSVEEFTGIQDLQDLQAARMDQMFSCIFVVRQSLMQLFDEDLAIVPTYPEAEDYFGMEDMERQLLDGDA